MSTNQIEQQTFIAAPAERVWAVLTEPAHIVGWFGDTAEIELEQGGRVVLGWTEHGEVHAVVEKLEPPRVFAFRWSTEFGVLPAPGASTLVEFTLTPDGEGTLLRVVESGFDELAVPAEDQRRRYQENTEGWTQELGELKTYAEKLDS